MKKALTLLFSSCCILLFSCKQAGDAVVETLLRNQTEAFNKTGGKMLDAQTRMDSIGVRSGRQLVYYYTLVHYTKQDLDTNVVKQKLISTIKDAVINNTDLKDLRDKNVDFLYLYNDKRGKYFFSINVKPTDYIKK
jgi:hypothetical protein